jgi:hypothetical protein
MKKLIYRLLEYYRFRNKKLSAGLNVNWKNIFNYYHHSENIIFGNNVSLGSKIEIYAQGGG